jgi:predicted transposase YbfD/YdcC
MSLPFHSVGRHFRKLKDPRRKHRQRHRFLSIIVIALCAVIANCDDWQKVEVFAQERREWLATFLDLPNGTPSHDTFERVFACLDPDVLQRCLLGWIQAISGELKIDHIAIDGKTLRHSGSPTRGIGTLHLVSAWATTHGLSLGQVAVDDKSNEITAIPRLLELLTVKGALVTIDAMGCQKEIAKKIVEGGGDYILPVKGNQEHLQADIEAAVIEAIEKGVAGKDFETYDTEEKGHGRHEKRHYTILPVPKEGIRGKDEWEKLTMIGVCYRERTCKGKTSEETVYFIGSREMSAKQYGTAIRGHWGIENKLHWHLDVTFGEDANRVREKTEAANLALLRKVALVLLKQDESKGSLATKRVTAALNPDFLAQILVGSKKVEKA